MKSQMHDSCAPTCRITINLFARLLINCQLKCGADARAVRPYMHSSSSSSPPFHTLIRPVGYVGTHGSCVRSIQNVCIYTWFFGRTHGPCVPTCIRAARPPLHFTHQSGLCGYVGTHGSCVRSMRDNQLVHPFTYQLSIKLIINDLHLAFQSHPFRRAISAILLPNMAHFTAQYG